LRSLKDAQFYVGLTDALRRRFDKHQRGLVPSTHHWMPVELVCHEACRDRHDADGDFWPRKRQLGNHERHETRERPGRKAAGAARADVHLPGERLPEI